MIRRVGRLVYADLGTGGWLLVEDDGGRTQLLGDVPRQWDGRRVVVHGHPRDAYGLFMGGDSVVEIEEIVEE